MSPKLFRPWPPRFPGQIVYLSLMMLRGNVAIASKGAAPVLLAPSVCAASACCSPRPLADRAHDFVPTQQFGQLVGTWGQREQQRQARTHRRSSMQARQVMGGRGGAAGPLGHQTPQQQQQLRQQMQMQMLRQQQEEEEVQDPKTMGGKLRWWEDLEDEQDRRDEEDFTLLTRDEVWKKRHMRCLRASGIMAAQPP